MNRKHTLVHLTTALVLLVALSRAVESKASPMEIIPGERRIDWSLTGIPGGIPERTSICATIDSAVYGNGAPTPPPPSRMRWIAARTARWCTCRKASTLSRTRSTCMTTIPCAAPDPARRSSSISGVLRSMVDMRGLIYWQIAGLHKTYAVLEANKDSQVITLASTAGIPPGDILLINQLNDNDIVDPLAWRANAPGAATRTATGSWGSWSK